MKNKLHKLLLKLRLYNIIYKGHFTIGKTIVGQHFIIGDYVPLSLKRCIELERGYHQESYMKMEHDVQQKAPSRRAPYYTSVGAAALLMTGCSDHNKLISTNGTMLPTPHAMPPDPPHS